MHKIQHRIGLLIVLAIFVAAGWLLYHELKHYHIRDIHHALRQIPAWRLWAAVALTALNYAVLIGYDYLAIRAIGHPLGWGKVALASFTGFVTSYNFGALLGGTSVRYRLYSSWGLSAVEILQLVIMLAVTFWVGIFALAGVFFIVEPFPIPGKLHLPFHTVQPLGFMLLGFTVLYIMLTFLHRKPIRIRDTQIQLPRPGVTVLQLAVAAADLTVAAASLYVLVSHDLSVNYGEFLGMYLLAVVAVIVTHVPGGVGVFELVVLTLAGNQSSASMVAALLVFRIIYYLLPLLLALILLAGNEIAQRRETAARVWGEVGRWAGTFSPSLMAVAAFAAGAVLLFSGVTPILDTRLEPLEQTIPLPLVEVSHFVSSLAGAGLLVLARGLQRRLDSAWWLSIGLLAGGIASSLLKGFDYEEAIILALVMMSLFACRKRFYRRGSLVHERFTTGWTAAVLLTVLCSIWLGLFAHKHVDYSSQLWWQFAFRSDAPRFLRASVGMLVTLLLFAFSKLMSAHEPPPAQPTRDDLEAVADIVAATGRASAYLALLGDKSLLFNQHRDAFVMYATEKRSWVAMGDPVGVEDERKELVWKYRELVDRYGGWPVFYQVGQENLATYLEQGMTLLKLGEEARVPLRTFVLEGGSRKGLRQTRNRCQREECHFEVVPRLQVPPLLSELESISDAWLAEKKIAEKGFSLGFFDRAYLQRFPCALIRRGGKIVAFANMWCGANLEELSVDLMRYLPGSASGVMEFLFIELMLWGKEQGYQWFNLGMAPLSGIENRPLAPLWNRTVNLVFRHGDHFYHFEGLREYKDKFNPVWSPKYLASPGGLALPRVLADVAALIGRKRQS